MSWTQALGGADVEVTEAGPDRVSLAHGGESGSFSLVFRRRGPRPSEVGPPPGPAALLVAPDLSKGVRERLRSLGWSWVTIRGDLRLAFPGHVVESDSVEPAGAETGASDGTAVRLRGLGVYAVARALIVAGPTTQARLAVHAGVSQARVSQVLDRLADAGLVDRARGAWKPHSWDTLVDWWLRSYPGPGGTTLLWYGLEDPWSQALTAVGALVGAQPVVSGDLAADLLASWRQPAHAVVYARHASDLTSTGLTSTDDPAAATLIVRIPVDASIWPATPLVRRFRGRSVEIADPLQVLWDLARSPGSDAGEATDVFRRWFADLVAVKR